MLLLPVRDLRPHPFVPLPLSAADTGQAIAFLDLVTGQALVLVGVIALLPGSWSTVGALTVMAGVCWFGQDLFALAGAHGALRAMGLLVLDPLLLPVLLQVASRVLAVDREPRVKLALRVASVAAILVAAVSLLTYDAFRDTSCRDCAWTNPFQVPGTEALVGRIGLAQAIVAGLVAVGALVVAVAGTRHVAATVAGPRVLAWLAAWVMVVASSVTTLAMVMSPTRDPTVAIWALRWWAVAATAWLCVLAVGWATLRRWTIVDRMRRIASSLEAAPPPGTLGTALATALGDDTVRIAYVLSDGGLIDAAGTPVDMSTELGRARLVVARDDERLAVVDHAAKVEDAVIAAAFTPSLLMALDNERLRAARLARLLDLRASRARIVAITDRARQQLERDLHDGAQQALLAVLFDVRLARATAERAGDRGLARGLGRAEVEAREAVDELRRLARGVHPEVLDESGLAAALASLAEEAPIPLAISSDPVPRVDARVESVAYRAVVRAIDDARRRGATWLRVAVQAVGTSLLVELEDDGRAAEHLDVAAPGVPTRIMDQVGPWAARHRRA